MKAKREKDANKGGLGRLRTTKAVVKLFYGVEGSHEKDTFFEGEKAIYRIAKVSANQQKTNSNLAKIKAKKIIETGATCESCGMSSRWLDLSHFVPRSIRKDLEERPDGCALACRGCHDALESLKGKEIAKFANLQAILDFLLENDLKRYNLVLNSINKTK
jgi:hypothetical protein